MAYTLSKVKFYKRFSSYNVKDERKCIAYIYGYASNSNLNCKSSFIHIKTHRIPESTKWIFFTHLPGTAFVYI